MSFILSLKRDFAIRGVFWRRLLAWSSRNVPHYLEPLFLALWTAIFFIFWPAGRNSVCCNLRVIAPPSNLLVRLGRAYRVFWNFACTFSDTMRFTNLGIGFDWQIEGDDKFDLLAKRSEGSIILTAHMGNYDLGSYMFAQRIDRPIVIVRAAEADVESDRDSREHRESVGRRIGSIRFHEPSADLALTLVSELKEGSLVAIQGDRVIAGTAGLQVTMFGRRVELPAGPFALAMATGVPLFPLVVVRDGRRQYRVIAMDPIQVTRTGRNRERDLLAGMAQWSASLENLLRREYTQWYTFFPFFEHASL